MFKEQQKEKVSKVLLNVMDNLEDQWDTVLCIIEDQVQWDQHQHQEEYLKVNITVEKGIILNIDSKKDVDAFHPENVGKIMIGDYSFLPCTPAGVMELIKRTGIEVAGKNCVVIGRSNIVGKPMAMLLLHANGTVTVCHSKTANIKEICRSADILVASVGKANFVSADMVKEGAVVIDVGINRMQDGKLCGDVNYAEVEPIASYITPVPGGVGPMTITMLLRNTLTAAKIAAEK